MYMTVLTMVCSKRWVKCIISRLSIDQWGTVFICIELKDQSTIMLKRQDREKKKQLYLFRLYIATLKLPTILHMMCMHPL